MQCREIVQSVLTHSVSDLYLVYFSFFFVLTLKRPSLVIFTPQRLFSGILSFVLPVLLFF